MGKETNLHDAQEAMQEQDTIKALNIQALKADERAAIIKAITETIKEDMPQAIQTVKEAAEGIKNSINTAEVKTFINNAAEQVEAARRFFKLYDKHIKEKTGLNLLELMKEESNIADFFNSKTWKEFFAGFSACVIGIEKYLKVFTQQAGPAEIFLYRREIKELEPLFPYILQELEKIKPVEMLDLMRAGDGKTPQYIQIIEAAKKAAPQEMQKLRPVMPAALIMDNSKPLRLLTTKGEFQLDKVTKVNLWQKGNENILSLAISSEKIKNILITDLAQTGEKPNLSIKLSAFQEQVYYGLCSLYTAAEKANIPCIFTTEMLFRVIAGGDARKRHLLTERQKQETENALQIMAAYFVSVDGSKLKNNTFGKHKLEKRHENFIQLEGATFKNTVNSKTVTGWILKKKPIFLEMAENQKQIISVPVEWLETKMNDMSTSRIAIRGYLIRRIKTKGTSKKILWTTIWSATEQKAYRATIKRNKDFIFSCLNEWKEKELIKGFFEDKEGITVEPKNEKNK